MPDQLARLMLQIDGAQRIVVVVSSGFGNMLVWWPDIQFANHFTPGELMPDQLARLTRQMDGAQRIAVVISSGFSNMLIWYPDIPRLLDGHELLWKGKSFAVYGARKPR